MGDASDNIPGVKGIGNKTACELLKEFDNLEGISKDILEMEESPKKEKEIVDFKSSKFLKKLSYEGLKNRWPRICKNQNIYIGEIETKTNKVVDQEYINELYKKYEKLQPTKKSQIFGIFFIIELIQYLKLAIL